MNNVKNRNEVNLSDEVLQALKELAEKDDRSLKNYMEKVLTKHVERKIAAKTTKDADIR